MRARFDRIFLRHTGFATLDRLLKRLHANKAELLRALDRPEIPLHTNGSENDIRCQVTKRQITGGTHSATGRDCRDAFLGLAKTCRKPGVTFWDYLGARLGVFGGPTVPHLPDLIRCRAARMPNLSRPDSGRGSWHGDSGVSNRGRSKRRRALQQTDLFRRAGAETGNSGPARLDLPEDARIALVGFMAQLMLAHARAIAATEAGDDC